MIQKLEPATSALSFVFREEYTSLNETPSRFQKGITMLNVLAAIALFIVLGIVVNIIAEKITK